MPTDAPIQDPPTGPQATTRTYDQIVEEICQENNWHDAQSLHDAADHFRVIALRLRALAEALEAAPPLNGASSQPHAG